MFHNMRDVPFDSIALQRFKDISDKLSALRRTLLMKDEGQFIVSGHMMGLCLDISNTIWKQDISKITNLKKVLENSIKFIFNLSTFNCVSAAKVAMLFTWDVFSFLNP